MFTVTNDDDSGPGSLRYEFNYATNSANPGSGNDVTIEIAAGVGTITLDSPLFTASGIDATTLTIETASPDDPQATITAAASGYRFFDLSGNDTPPITLSNLNIYGFSSAVSYNGSILQDNADGGAIRCTSPLTVTGCTFNANMAVGSPANSATGNGGAIYATQSLTVTGCLFTDNSATWSGGAIYDTAVNTSADGLTITSSTFGAMGMINTAENGNGGAVYFNTDAGTLTVSGDTTTFTGNTAPLGLGGAIYQSGGTILATSSMEAAPGTGFVGNTDSGGAADGEELYLTQLTQAHIDIPVAGPPGTPAGALIYLESTTPPQQPGYWVYVNADRVAGGAGSIVTNWPLEG